MEGVITFELVTFLTAAGAVVFSVYHFFRKPDIKNNTAIKLLQEQLNSEKEISKLAITTTQNHVHTLTNKVNDVEKSISGVGKDIVRLTTIIDERIPKK